MRVARLIVGAWLIGALVFGAQLLAAVSGIAGPIAPGRVARAAAVADPGNYHLTVKCITAAGGAYHCGFFTSVDADDLPVMSFIVPAAVLCAEVVAGEDFTALDDGSLLFAGDSGWVDFATGVTVDPDQTAAYVLNAGDEGDEPDTVTVEGPGLVCAAAPATIKLAVVANRTGGGMLLPAACFEVYAPGESADDRTLVGERTCDGEDGLNDGTTHFSGLPANSTLVVVETRPPAGYQLADEQMVEAGKASRQITVSHEPVSPPAQTEVAIYALYCAADPGHFDLEAMENGVVPDGCHQATGVAYAVTEDGQPAPEGWLTTDQNGAAQVTVPTGAVVVLRQISELLLPGFSPVANPISLGPVAGDRVDVLFLNLRDATPSDNPSPSPSDSSGPSPDPAAPPSPSPAPSTDPSASQSPSPDDGAAPGSAPSTLPSPATNAGTMGTAHPSDPGGPSGSGRSGVTTVRQLPATGSGEPAPAGGDLPLILALLALALAGGWLRWRLGHRSG